MWPISAACAQALRGSHTRTPVIEVFNGFGPMIASSYSTPRIQLEHTGEIRVDRTAKHVRMLSATLIDIDGTFAPAVSQPIVDPLRRPQMQVYFRIGWNDPATGTAMTEDIPAGRFTITRTKDSEIGAGSEITIEGTSRSSSAIEQNTWLAPYNVPGVVGYDGAIRAALVDRSLPGWQQVFRFETSLTDTPIGMVFDGVTDPWTELQQLAVTDGKELFDDQVGAFVLRTAPVAAGAAPVWAYDESVTSPRLRNTLSRDTDGTTIYNGVMLGSSGPWLPFADLVSVKWDEDPTSPTYYLGSFGRHPLRIDNFAAATQEQNDAACIAKFNDTIGVAEQIDAEALPNPAHDPGDIVTVASAATGLNDVAVLQSFTLPFDVTTSMPFTIKRRRTR